MRVVARRNLEVKALLRFCSDAKICRPSFIKCINIETNDRNVMQIGISMPCVISTGQGINNMNTRKCNGLFVMVASPTIPKAHL